MNQPPTDIPKIARKKEGDISVTALYTAQTWVYGGFEDADLLATKEAKRVFDVTNLALKVMNVFQPSPELAPSLVQRHAMFDHLVLASGATQVIEVAAGLSRRGAALSKDAGLRYVEIDLPPMSARKQKLLGRTPAGRAVLERPNLTFVASDVREIDLSSLIEPRRPTCVIAEGLFMYLQATEQRALWGRVADALKRTAGGDFVFDLTPVPEKPKDGATGRILAALMRFATGGRGFEVDARTRDEITSELRSAGFDSVEVLDASAIKHAWGLPFPTARTQMVVWHCRIGPR